MRKISKIKLNQFSQDELSSRKLNALKGGCGCTSGDCGACSGSSDWAYYNNDSSNNKAYHY